MVAFGILSIGCTILKTVCKTSNRFSGCEIYTKQKNYVTISVETNTVF
jgi:hypothetical protein